MNDNTFIKVHRSHIVNLEYFDRLEKLGEPKIILSNDDEVPVSRANRDLLIEVLENFGKN